MAHQVERQLQELGDRSPANERARAEQMINEIRELVRTQSTDVARLRQLTSDLQQILYGLGSAATAGQSAQPGPEQKGADDVVDADFRKAG
jgi:molecular chaperone DnaK